MHAAGMVAVLGLLQLGGAVPEAGIDEVTIRVGDRSVRALCTDGARRVMLWHGDGGSADGWRAVLERLDGSVGACAFDRVGSGDSGPAPGARGWYELLDELRRIHVALGFERDYVLVGQSLSGLYARVFAADRPEGELAGLVLVDPAHEDMLSRLRLGMPRQEWRRRTDALARPNRDGIVERDLAPRARRAVLPPVPVTVITATRRRDGDGWDARFVQEAALQLHATILDGATAGRHVPAQRSGHDVQLDEPGLVAEEILRIVRLERGR